MLMPTVTAQDLEDWSPRLDARAHLPTLVRRLIFASVRPDQIVVPDAEGTGLPGLDGILSSAAGARPYVPAGRSAWELKTSGDPQKELGKDFLKRTKQLSDADRAVTTIVLVTTRIWDRASVDSWIARRAGRGWAGIQVLTAEDLATWLAQCPGVLGWLEQHCGRNPYGQTALRDWWETWSDATEPGVPPALLLAGRAVEREGLLAGLAKAPSSQVLAAATEEEAIAFIAGSLLRPRQLPADEAQALGGEGVAIREAADASWLEAILERTIVVHDTSAWRSLAAHHEPLVLIPAGTCEPTIDAAVRSGHHVVIPRSARPGDRSLPRLNRTEARDAWEHAGISWDESDELARAARRSLTSLRRRRGRAGHLRRPDWSSGTTSRLLAPLLLAGSWDARFAGDERFVLELADRQSLRTVDGDLAVIASEPDPPVRQSHGGWQFVDPVDAWDQLAPVLSKYDLDVLRRNAIDVLTYQDPTLELPTAERLAASVRGDLPSPEYSQTLREGFAETIAILGAVRESTPLPGGGTGGDLASRMVHDLLHGAPAARWREVADLLPELAEAAPSTFLTVVEESLREASPPILTLFNEQADDLGLTHHSAHTHLLWALEHLAFSPAHLSRVVVVLGLLTENDPGGNLGNRPANSLNDILHPVFPQSAADRSSRAAAIDALRTGSPEASWQVLLRLIQNLEGGILLNRAPKHRDWPRAEPPTRLDVFQTIEEIGHRIVDDTAHDPERWAQAAAVIGNLPPTVRTRMLNEARDAWDQLPDDAQRAVVSELKSQISLHSKYRDSAWALDEEGLADLSAFVDQQATEADEPGDHLLFTFWPDIDGVDPDTSDGQAALKARREDAVRAALPDGLPALAAASEVPGHIGTALASITADLDDHVLPWLAGDEPHLQTVAYGLARARQDEDPDWLWRVIEAYPDLAVDLLLTAGMTPSLISHVDSMSEEDQVAFWSKVSSWGVPDELRLIAATHLVARDRPYSAMNLLFRQEDDTFPVDLGVEVMLKPLLGTTEKLDGVLHSPGYVMGGMLDRLAEAGAPIDDVAILEWGYHGAFSDRRRPAALNMKLASDPLLFARLVELTTHPDDDDVDETDSAGRAPQDAVEAEAGDKDDPGGDGGTWTIPDTPETRLKAFKILRKWRTPLPGSVGDDPPTTEALQSWVLRARTRLASVGRERAGAHQIGRALSGPAYDPDGIWPCRAVRDVLEHENDSDIESGSWTGRLNDRGVSTRGPYSGGQQERDLAAKYKGWADQVRNSWPRTGALLDSIAQDYESDARREDGRADELGDR